MSFWPLAKTLTERLHAAAALGPLVELGCGSGGFVRQLARAGIDAMPIDRKLAELRALSSEARAQGALCADARKLPFADGSLGAIVCANLLRGARDSWPEIARSCRQSLATDGLLLVLEDDAEDVEAAAHTYRETLRLLAAVDASRGPAMRGAEIDALCEEAFGAATEAGCGRNELAVEDPQLPLRWLRAHVPDAARRDELERLQRRVRAHGMSYGCYVYRLYVREDA